MRLSGLINHHLDRGAGAGCAAAGAGAADLLQAALKVEQAIAAGCGRARGVEAASVVLHDEPETMVFEIEADADFAGGGVLDDVVEDFFRGEVNWVMAELLKETK